MVDELVTSRLTSWQVARSTWNRARVAVTTPAPCATRMLNATSTCRNTHKVPREVTEHGVSDKVDDIHTVHL